MPSGHTVETIPFLELSKFFRGTITDASKSMGVCETVLKKTCRSYGISRWPHRKIKSLERMMDVLQSSPAIDLEEQKKINEQVLTLRQKLHNIFNSPKQAKRKNNTRSHSKSAVQDSNQVTQLICQISQVSAERFSSQPAKVSAQLSDAVANEKGYLKNSFSGKDCHVPFTRLPSITCHTFESQTDYVTLPGIHTDLSNWKNQLPTLEPQPLLTTVWIK